MVEQTPVEALNQALLEQRMDGVEKSVMEIIARALGVPIEIVHRVNFASETLFNIFKPMPGIDILTPHESWGELIPEKVQNALRSRMEAGARRYMVRWAIENKKHLEISPQALLKPEEVARMCDGCPSRHRCIGIYAIVAGEPFSTPQKCYDGHIHRVNVTPIRIHKNKVDIVADQPTGKYTVPIEAFPLTRY